MEATMMSVTIDDHPLAAEQLGLTTVGQVLSHVARANRLVVNVLIDGEEPDLGQMPTVRAVPLVGRTVYVETADPREMAREVLDGVASHLSEADAYRTEAAEALTAGQHPRAMQKLNACFGIWQHAHQSVVKTAQLLRVDLTQTYAGGQTIAEMLVGFAEQLRQIKGALEGRDFVSLADTLAYEMTETTERWTAAIDALRAAMHD
jgi:hypothetical protein